MGNCNSEPKTVPDYYSQGTTPQLNSPKPPPQNGRRPEPSRPTSPEPQFTKYLRDFQEKTYARMENDMKNDPKIFILNQLLLSFQFYDNFERAKTEAQVFKEKTEKEINERFERVPTEGAIGGERKAILTHAMGEVLSRFYIYRPARGDEDALYTMAENEGADDTVALSSMHLGSSSKSFLCDSILPLDFVVTLENFEAHLETPWDEEDPDNTYSTSAGELPTFKCFMEEPDRKNKLPRGYVRLRTGASRRGGRAIGEASDTYDYSHDHDAEFYKSKGSSRISSIVSDTEEDYIDGESTLDMTPGQKMMQKLGKHVEAKERVEGVSRPPNLNLHNAVLKKPATRFANPTVVVTSPKNPSPHFSGNSLTSSSSRAESVISSQAPTHRRPVEIKELWQFKPKRLLQSHDKSSIPPDLLITVEMEPYEDDEDISKGSDDEMKELEINMDQVGEEDEDADSNYSIVRRPPSELAKIERTYLNSTEFAALFFGDFQTLGSTFGISQSDISEGQVLGASIRCSVKYPLNSRREEFKQLYTFSPAIHSKNWPQKARVRFVHRMLQQVHSGNEEKFGSLERREFAWLTGKQTSTLIEVGCDLLPQGFRSVEFFNKYQSMEWQVDFPKAETLLLETFKRVHWRLYIMTAILFRACLSPLGPMGVTLEHVRHILYSQCDEDYFRWYDEEPGRHLLQLMDELYNCVAFRSLPNFFLPKCNMLKSATPQNALVVQFCLRKVQENILPYCIHSFRNLECRADAESFWPKVDLKHLYELITLEDTVLFQKIIRDNVRMPEGILGAISGDTSRDPKKHHKKKPYRGISKTTENDGKGPTTTPTNNKNQEKEDRYKNFRQQQYNRHMARKKKEQQEERRRRKQEQQSANMIPHQEKRKSIDLDKPIVRDYKNYRLSAVIEFFIPHFLNMGEKAIKLESFPEATMYALHVQNLCKLVVNSPADVIQPIEPAKMETYSRRAQAILDELGPKREQYITTKLRNPESAATEAFLQNFLSPRNKPRTLPPTPKSSTRILRPDKFKTVELSRIGESLKHMPHNTIGSKPSDYNPRIHEEFHLEPQDDLVLKPPPQAPPKPPSPVPPKKPQSILRKPQPIAAEKIEQSIPITPRRQSTTSEDYSSDDDSVPNPIIRFKSMNTNSVFVRRTPSFFSATTGKQ